MEDEGKKRTISRRNVLKVGGLLLAGATKCSLVPEQAHANSQNKNEVMKTSEREKELPGRILIVDTISHVGEGVKVYGNKFDVRKFVALASSERESVFQRVVRTVSKERYESEKYLNN